MIPLLPGATGSCAGPCSAVCHHPCTRFLSFFSVSRPYIFVLCLLQVTALPTNSDDWCRVGAYTRLANYHDWIVKTVQYLDTNWTAGDSHMVSNEEEDEVEEEEEEAEEDNPCLSSPCGQHASCWNGAGGNFLCTCDAVSYTHLTLPTKA